MLAGAVAERLAGDLFISEDPIGFAAGPNFYAYAGNSPATFTDPFGLITSGRGEADKATSDFFWQFLGGVRDFLRQKDRLTWVTENQNLSEADKYFHCMANCEASRRGPGRLAAAEIISEAREWSDATFKGDTPAQCNADRAANKRGREGDPNLPCSTVCWNKATRYITPWFR